LATKKPPSSSLLLCPFPPHTLLCDPPSPTFLAEKRIPVPLPSLFSPLPTISHTFFFFFRAPMGKMLFNHRYMEGLFSPFSSRSFFFFWFYRRIKAYSTGQKPPSKVTVFPLSFFRSTPPLTQLTIYLLSSLLSRFFSTFSFKDPFSEYLIGGPHDSIHTPIFFPLILSPTMLSFPWILHPRNFFGRREQVGRDPG